MDVVGAKNVANLATAVHDIRAGRRKTGFGPLAIGRKDSRNPPNRWTYRSPRQKRDCAARLNEDYNAHMTSLKQIIVEKFLGDLAAKRSLDEAKIAALRKLLTENPKVKADDFVKVFTADEDDVA